LADQPTSEGCAHEVEHLSNTCASIPRHELQHAVKVSLGLGCKVDGGKQQNGEICGGAKDRAKQRRNISGGLARCACEVHVARETKQPFAPGVGAELLDKLRETPRKGFDKEVELRRDLGTEEPTYGGEHRNERQNDGSDCPGLRYGRPATHHASEVAQQERQKSRPERQNEHIGKPPDGERAHNCEN
jgi:hypothetical protein